MKKSLFALMALVFCLSACTPAESTIPESDTTPASETPAEAGPAEETAPEVGNLQSIEQRRNTGEACYTYQVAQGEIRKLDYANARVETLYQFDEPGTVYNDVIVQQDALYAVTDGTLYQLPLDGGEVTTQPLQPLPGSRTPIWCDEHAVYIIDGNPYNPPENNVACRIDLKTGEITDLPLPYIVLDNVYAAEGSLLLLRRVVTEQPLPSYEEKEAFDAVLQNATSEYDWWDLNTGELEKVLQEPYEGELDEEGNTSKLNFLGKTAERLYFQTIVYNPDKGNMPGELVSFRLDGSDRRTEKSLSDETLLAPLERDGELCWLLDNSGARMQVYDVATGTDYDVGPGSQQEGYPLAFTDDGRVLVIAKWHGAGTMDYGLLPVEAYLAGSTDWTPITDAPDRGTIIVF